MAEVKGILPGDLERESRRKWRAYSDSAEKAGETVPADPAFRETGAAVFAFSDFVARSCIRDPHIPGDLVRSGDLLRAYAGGEFGLRMKNLNPRDPSLVSRELRRLRAREMVRIAWRDLAGWAGLDETMAELTAFAEACIEKGLSVVSERLSTLFGRPFGKKGGEQSLVVIGMGKLGAGELNFSSDIDLVFAFPENGEIQGGDKRLSNEEFFLRVSRQLIQTLGGASPDGPLFRVDMRLRPFGENGPLVMSFDTMEEYYQREGREWERYAWIKARAVAGDREAGARLLERLKPFVYRRYLDYGAFESLRDMKRKIALEERRKGMKLDIKLGPGGIREIEFFGQMFQLIRGGVVPTLQEPSIQKVLSILAEERFIPPDVSAQLLRGYRFLRILENRLQEFSDQQIHTLPAELSARGRLAASLGFSSPEAFSMELERRMAAVHTQFSTLLEDESEKARENGDSELERIWSDPGVNGVGAALLADAGFPEPEEALRLLRHLRSGLESRRLSPEGWKRVNRLIPLILKSLAVSERPVLALNRIGSFLLAVSDRPAYLALLLENRSALAHLVRLAAASSWIASFLSRHPLLLDELLDPRALFRPPEAAELSRELRHRMSRLPPDDLEARMEALRIFKQANMLRVAAADITGAVPLMRVSDHLTYLAEALIAEVVELSWEHLVKRHGKPTCLLEGKPCGRGFAVLAYGKMGGLELGYDSDLDLVFLHAGVPGRTEGGTQPIDNTQFFARLGQRVLHILGAHTSTGILYEIDMRLRPSGSSGLLVSQAEAFRAYQTEDAWTWEHQALTRARPIVGEDRLTEYFARIRREVLARKRDPVRLAREVTGMRERLRKEHDSRQPDLFDLKQGRGGIVDIEFLVQYLVLLHAASHPELLRWPDNVRIIGSLQEAGILDDIAAYLLRKAYLTFRSAMHRRSLQEMPPLVPDGEFRPLREAVTRIRDHYLSLGDKG